MIAVQEVSASKRTGRENVIAKIRLNNTQWAQLVGLKSALILEPGGKSTQLSVRLVSHGLVSQDATGHFYLTERGQLRLGLGQ